MKKHAVMILDCNHNMWYVDYCEFALCRECANRHRNRLMRTHSKPRYVVWVVMYYGAPRPSSVRSYRRQGTSRSKNSKQNKKQEMALSTTSTRVLDLYAYLKEAQNAQVEEVVAATSQGLGSGTLSPHANDTGGCLPPGLAIGKSQSKKRKIWRGQYGWWAIGGQP